MYSSVFQKIRTSALTAAVCATFAGCGGGGGSNDEQSTVAAAPIVSTSTTITGATSTSTIDAGATHASTGTDTSTDQNSTTTVAIANTPDVTVDAASDVVQVAAAAATTSKATTTTPSIKPAVGTRTGAGMNLTAFATNSPELATIDQMKKSGGWLTQCNYCTGFTIPGATTFDTKEEAQLDLDANGWIRSLPAANSNSVKYRSVTTTMAAAGVQQAGNYVVVYDGSGTLSYSGAATKIAAQSKAGRDVVAVTNSSALGWFLNIVATDPTNYIRNIRVFPPGGACASDLTTYVASADKCTAATGKFVAFENFPAGSTWHPTFVNDLKKFRTLRFMDWGNTNLNLSVNWSEHTSTGARSWNSTTGAPYEAMFDLASKTGADPWMNVPARANDDYVHQFGKLAHGALAPNQTLYLEYGNEMWNFMFANTQWALNNAKTTWPTEVAKGANLTGLELDWYAMRLVQVCQIVKAEFGADASRVKCVANTQAAVVSGTNEVLKCTAAAASLGKPCGKLIDAVAIAPYFGGYIGNAKLRSTVSAWYSDADGGLNKVFQELTGADASGNAIVAPLNAAGTTLPKGSLGQAQVWMTSTKALLDTYGLPMYAYEGGQGMTVPAGDTDQTLLNLMYAANRDPRMGAAYQTMYQQWQAAGGQQFMFFADVGVYTKYGTWGLKESQFDNAAPKWKAVTGFRDSVSCWWSGC